MDIDKIPADVLEDLRKRGHEDDRIATMTPESAFGEYCNWNGFLGYGPILVNALDGLRAASEHVVNQLSGQKVACKTVLTEELARDMGAKGGQPTEAERLLFEAWMRGHCWAISGVWNGETYVADGEKSTGRWVEPQAMMTRMLWAAWRDRAALAGKS